MYVNDIEGAYAAPIVATGNPTLMADCERYLASILRSRRVAKDLMVQIFGNTSINGLAGMSQALRLWLNQPEQLGLADAQLKALQGALDLGSMMYAKQDERSVIDDPSVAAAYFTNQIGWETVEHFAVLVLDVKHRVLGYATIARGTATETLAHPREILHPVLRLGGCRFIVGHNHPSGTVEQSPEDVLLTRQLLKAAASMGIPLLDHLIVAKHEFRSLRETTNLWTEIPQE
jgi:DNA repair protein RadC